LDRPQPDLSRETWLRQLIASTLAVDPATIDPDSRLHGHGLTSLNAAEVTARIAAATGRSVSPTLLWDHPTLRRLETFLAGEGESTRYTHPDPMAGDDAIAITGIACRFPGADNPDAFWRMLCEGVDAITEVPSDRWSIDALYNPDPLAPGSIATRWGGFIKDPDRFDAGFFGLSPTEAAQADPQQRLALELAWEAVEDAGLRASRLSGSRTGVFMGAMWSDYARLMAGPQAIAPHTATGQDISIISARIAYVLGLEGPALTVDTACSSALVAVHLACRSLRSGETTRALAGGVHLVLSPESAIAMTKFGAMAPDGRCRTFDAAASGYVRGEGGGVVMLQPLSAARAEGARVYAIIRGSAMNNDGPSNGLTAPNPAAQRAMMRDALHDARLDAAAIDYVEAHGTGTRLGDPIEARALAAVLCGNRVRPLAIGSVKTNIGHLEAAAGAAGLIKLALSLYHRWIPPSLHFQAPNPAIDFAGLQLDVQSRGAAWPVSPERAPAGGVSSFGFGGTNCHAILEGVATKTVGAGPVFAPVFVFAGNGGNWPGMATALMAEPVFRASLARSSEILTGLGYGMDVVALLTASPPDNRVSDVALGQPALCAFQLALTELLRSRGILPAAVIGHSVGEAAAAACSGRLTAAQALAIVVARSRLQARTAGQGGMAMVVAPAPATAARLDGLDVVVAGENGPRATLISGAPDAIEAACRRLDAAGIESLRIAVPVAYHSPQMDAVCGPLADALAGLEPAPSGVPMVSTVTGHWVDQAPLDAAYWPRNMREPVAFRQGIATLADAGFARFLEIGPRPLLAAQISQTVPQARVVSPSWRPTADTGPGATLDALAAEFASAAGGVATRDGERPRHLLVLSARSGAALDALAARWAAALTAETFADLCHTALVGRERFPHRLALHASSGTEAARRLAEGDVLRGVVPTGAAPDFDQTRQTGEDWLVYLDRCAVAFVGGADIDGVRFDACEPWRIVSAPTYAFERERHWLPAAADALSYEVQWQPHEVPPGPVPWPELTIAGCAPDPALDRLASHFAQAALAEIAPEAILPGHRALAARLAGWSGAGEAPPLADSAAARLLRRVGAALPAILTGQAEPLDVLFPGGDMQDAAAIYADAPFLAAQQALAVAIGRIAPRRVLEVGGGTGALTAQILPKLPAESAFVFSDLSTAFLAAAQARFAGYRGLRTALVDIDRPADLGERFDAVVAANVLHAGANIAGVLRCLAALLEPGGTLGLVELVRPPRWIDLVFGITEGWWRFAGDTLRPDHALMDGAQWRRVLEQLGFTDVVIADDGDAHAVILARAPARGWALAGAAAATVAALGLPQGNPAGLLYCAGEEPAHVLVDTVAALTEDGRPVSVLVGPRVAHAHLAGAARALSLTRPAAVGTILHLRDHDAETLARLGALLRAGSGAEDEIRIEGAAVSVARLARVGQPGRAIAIRPDRQYVVAGGTGRLGLAFARFLVARGARDLLLIGRSSARGAVPDLGAGIRVRLLSLDLTEDVLDGLTDAVDAPLGGVIHAAGIADGPAWAVIAGKLGIAARLGALPHPGFLLLFSSAAGVWGAADRVAYSAANRAMDHWAEQQRAAGLPVTSIAFGRFAEKGLLTEAQDVALDAAGLLPMAMQDAFAAALSAVGDGVAQRIVARVDWPRFAAAYSARRPRPLFDRVIPRREPATVSPRIMDRPAPNASGRLDAPGLTEMVAEILGHGDAARLDPDRGLFEQGLDSLLAVSLRRRLEAASGIAIPTAVLFSQPSIHRLVQWFAGQTPALPVAATRRGTSAPIAVVGIGCRFPSADGPEDFFARLMAGFDAVSPRPRARAFAGRVPDGVDLRWGTFLDGIDLFDATFFGISPREAAQMDPQQRLLLEVAWHGLEHAGIAPGGLAGTRTGVFIGATGSDYAALARAAGLAGLDAHSLVGQPSNTLAGRIAFQLGLRGPALTVDTACSSSLVAIHLAVRALRDGEADLAIAGGVNLILTADTSVMLSQAGLLSHQGRCATFDAAADGYVRGEGCGVVILKPLSAAVDDGDRVLAVITGSAMNHDGRSSSFTAPNGTAQRDVIAASLGDAGLRPQHIDFVEAHGTGTQLGDAVELDALQDAFAGRDRPLLAGSLKANFGHMEAAAGVAGLIKATLALQAGMLPPQIHFSTPNPHALADDVEVATTLRALPNGLRRGAVSAFGASGTNAHVVLESHDAIAQRRDRGVPLPPTSFQRKRHWLSTPQAAVAILGAPQRSARSGEEIRAGRLTQDIAWLRDHVVDGVILLPAVGFLELVRSTGILALADVAFLRKLVVPSAGIDVQLIRSREGEISLHAEDVEGWVLIASARIGTEDEASPMAAGLPAAVEAVTGADFAEELARRGFSFGPAYRLAQALRRDDSAAVLDLVSAGDLDPPRMDCALQVLTALLPEVAGSVWLPASIAAVRFARGSLIGTRARAHLVQRGPVSAQGEAVLEAADGAPVLSLRGLTMRLADRAETAGAADDLLHGILWHPVAAPMMRATGLWHAIGPGASALPVASFDEAGTAPIPQVDGVIDLRPLDAGSPEDCVTTVAALVARLAALPAPPQIVLLSRAAACIEPVAAGAVPAAAVLMGLQPVIAAEHPELRCRWLDIDVTDDPVQVVWGGPAGRFARRRGQWFEPSVEPQGRSMAGDVALATTAEGGLAGLALQRHSGGPAGAGEVEIGVSAAGLNFRDVLTVLGRAPEPRWALGLECAGIVLSIGRGVTGLSVGDAVIALGPGCLASRVTLPAREVVRRPDWLDEDTAATLPVAYLTAWRGLHEIAGMRPGTRVLIHAAAGGVGGAATQLARLAGARVFGTASQGKEAVAVAQGAEAVGDSRSTAFLGPARAWAGPAGFDVVVNALGTEIAEASASLLRPDGLFLEIGQAPRPARRDIRYRAYDLVAPLAEEGWFADRMGRILALLQAGDIAPPHRCVVALPQAREALQTLGQGRTIGKTVVRFPRPVALRGTILITGGTGVVGRALAAQLLARGAERVVLAARHARTWEAAPDERVQLETLDVTDRAAVTALLARLPDLRGVVHAAGSLRDGMLAGLRAADVATVFAAKRHGAELLDELTRDHALDHFVLVSSTASVMGLAGQAAYAAANAWLDRLAAARRTAGLAGVAIGFGPWEGGMVASLDRPHQLRLRREGYHAMPAARAAEGFMAALGSGVVHRIVMDRRRLATAEDPSAAAVSVPRMPEDRTALQQALARRLRALLGFARDAPLPPDRPLRDFGLDSLLAVSLRQELASAYGLDLPTTLLFDRPTLTVLTDYLWGLLAPVSVRDKNEFGDLDADALAALLASELEVGS
jgi:acyl transferase domain-containing protein/NADPH:quinone reductase-like Zn-dependent oxidoreductase/SAM-dependent methyltransferase/acyl carrier protein